MIAKVQRDADDRDLGSIEITEGNHATTTVHLWLNDDGFPIVQIDTRPGSDTHEVMRVYMNDAQASHWTDK